MIDFSATINDLKGNPLKQDGEDVTLRDTCTNALLAAFQGEQQDGKTKMSRWKLAQRIHDAKEPIELTAGDVTLLKEVVSKAYSAAVVGPAWTLLDPAEK